MFTGDYPEPDESSLCFRRVRNFAKSDC